jgi:uncharacterized protein YfbU (UPF0304 family)
VVYTKLDAWALHRDIIGQAERTFNTGFGEHVEAIRNNSISPVYANRTRMLNIWDNNEHHGYHKSWKKGKIIEAV